MLEEGSRARDQHPMSEAEAQRWVERAGGRARRGRGYATPRWRGNPVKRARTARSAARKDECVPGAVECRAGWSVCAGAPDSQSGLIATDGLR